MNNNGSVNSDADTTVEEISKPRRPRGFAAMSVEARKRISSLGGKKAHAVGTAHQFSSEEARKAGYLGGKAPHVRRGRGKKIVDSTIADAVFEECPSSKVA